MCRRRRRRLRRRRRRCRLGRRLRSYRLRSTRPQSTRSQSCRRRRRRRSCSHSVALRRARRARLPRDVDQQRLGGRFGNGSGSGLSSRNQRPRARSAAARFAGRRCGSATFRRGASATVWRSVRVRCRQPRHALPRSSQRRRLAATGRRGWPLLSGCLPPGNLARRRSQRRSCARLWLWRAGARGSTRRAALLGGRASSARRSRCRKRSHLRWRWCADVGGGALAFAPQRRSSSRVRQRRRRHEVERLPNGRLRPQQRRPSTRRSQAAASRPRSSRDCGRGGPHIRRICRRRRLACGRRSGRTASAARAAPRRGPRLARAVA